MTDSNYVQPPTRGNGRRRRPLPSQIGRSSKLTPEVQKKIVDAVRAGAFLSVAARYAGVSHQTLYNWMERGENCPSRKHKDAIYLDFLEEVMQAEAQAEVAANLQWRSAWSKDWHSAKDWLKGRYPERYDRQPDGTAPNQAFAGVNINIGGQTTPNSTSGPQINQEAATQPLEKLIEDNPRLLSALTHLFNETDSIFNPDTHQTEPNSPDSPQIAPQSTKMDDFGIIEGHFEPIDPETD